MIVEVLLLLIPKVRILIYDFEKIRILFSANIRFIES